MPLLESSKKCFYKLPYIGNSSIQTKKKFRVQFDLRSYVVYKIVCGSCKDDYIGRPKLHLSTRIKEHLETDKKSLVYKHLNESQKCKALSNNDCLSIIDYATAQFSLSIKEDMHIGWQKSALNKHIDFLTCSICM